MFVNPLSVAQASSAVLTNSGPLSLRRTFGFPRFWMTSFRTFTTRVLRIVPATSIARLSFVNSSISVKHFSFWPLPHPSNTKSYAQTSLGVVAANGCGGDSESACAASWLVPGALQPPRYGRYGPDQCASHHGPRKSGFASNQTSGRAASSCASHSRSNDPCPPSCTGSQDRIGPLPSAYRHVAASHLARSQIGLGPIAPARSPLMGWSTPPPQGENPGTPQPVENHHA